MVETSSVVMSLWHRPTFVAVCVAVLTHVIFGPTIGSHLALAAEEDETAPAQVHVEIHDGLLSVDVGNVPLSDVLMKIGEEAGVQMDLHDDLGTLEPRSFSDLPLEEGIRQLVGDHGMVMEYSDGEGAATPRLSAVRVYRRGDPGTVSQRLPLEQPDEPEMKEITSTSVGTTIDIAMLEEALDHEDAAVRLKAVEYSLRVGGPETITLLAEVAIEDEDPSVRAAAVQNLAAMGGPKARSVIKAAQNDPDEEVRLLAEGILAQMLAKQRTDPQ